VQPEDALKPRPTVVLIDEQPTNPNITLAPEEDNETPSRLRQQELVERIVTRVQPEDALKPRPTITLIDEQPTSPNIAPVPSLPADSEPVEANEAGIPIYPVLSAYSRLQEAEGEQLDFPDNKELPAQLSFTKTLPVAVEEEPAKKPNRRAIAALTVVCVAVFFTAMDQTVVVTALPKMLPDLQILATQIDHAAWIISAYLLGFVVAMPLMGRVSDIYGRRRIFLLCLSIFGISSIFCSLAPVMASIFDISDLRSLGIDTSSQPLVWMIAARLVQAIGGGAIVPIAMAVASDFYGQEKRGLALGIVGAVTEAGGALGPLYGALVVEHLGWQAIFSLNVPVVIILLVAGWFLIPRGRRLLQSIDWLGAALLAGALTCLSIGLAQQGTSLGPVTTNGSSASNPVALVLAVVFLAAFIVVEFKVRWPVVDLANFKRLAFSASSLVSLLIGAALIIAMADIPIYVDTVLRGSILESGLALLRLTVMIPIGAVVGGWLCNRFSCRWVGVASLLITGLGFYLMSQWPIQPNQWQITISTLVAGLGFGLVIAPIGTTAINSLWPSQAGVGSAVVTALRMVGMTLGLSVLTSWALARFQQLAAQYPTLSPKATPAQFTAWSQGYAAHLVESLHSTYCSVFLISMFICLLAIIPAFFLWQRQAPVEEPEEHALLLYEDEASLSPAILKQRKRKRLITIAVASLAVLVLVGGLTAEWFRENAEYGDSPLSTTIANLLHKNGPNTSLSASKLSLLALDGDALTSIFASQLNLQQGVLSDLSAVPGPNNGLVIGFNLHINVSGIQRTIPVEIDGTVGVDSQQNIQLTVQQFKRDGVVADANATASMQRALNEMLSSTVMPTLHNQFKGIKITSVYTSTSIPCAQNIEMFVLQIESTATTGGSAQPKPFCLRGSVDLQKLLPQA
jgi:MFS family permease